MKYEYKGGSVLLVPRVFVVLSGSESREALLRVYPPAPEERSPRASVGRSFPTSGSSTRRPTSDPRMKSGRKPSGREHAPSFPIATSTSTWTSMSSSTSICSLSTKPTMPSPMIRSMPHLRLRPNLRTSKQSSPSGARKSSAAMKSQRARTIELTLPMAPRKTRKHEQLAFKPRSAPVSRNYEYSAEIWETPDLSRESCDCCCPA